MNIKEALMIAIEDEERARDWYRDMAKNADDPETRLLFEQLAREEDGHFKRLTERLKAVKLMG